MLASNFFSLFPATRSTSRPQPHLYESRYVLYRIGVKSGRPLEVPVPPEADLRQTQNTPLTRF